jgi:hypothetical protein
MSPKYPHLRVASSHRSQANSFPPPNPGAGKNTESTGKSHSPWRDLLKIAALYVFALCLHTNSAQAAIAECVSPCAYGTISASCTTLCTGGTCKNTSTLPNLAGVSVITNKRIKYNCPTSETGQIGCECEEYDTTYVCGEGYYGTATGRFDGCTKCPENSSYCDGGNGTTFTCVAGYYKNGSECTSCKTATGESLATSVAGAAAITNCYIPMNVNITDGTGTYSYTSNCNYSN